MEISHSLGIMFESYLCRVLSLEMFQNVLKMFSKWSKSAIKSALMFFLNSYFVNFSPCLRTPVCQCLRMDLDRRIDLYKKSSEVRVMSHGLSIWEIVWEHFIPWSLILNSHGVGKKFSSKSIRIFYENNCNKSGLNWTVY